MTALRVLICEDSRAYVVALRRTLEYDGDITVTAECATAEAAITALPRVQPDLVTMDIELPGMDGLEAVEVIMSARPLPVLVLLSHVSDGSNRAAAALAAGALDALGKDDLDLRDPASAAGVAFRQRVRLLSRARVIRHPRARLTGRRGLPWPAADASVIGVCASTGGPSVLANVLAALPADYPIPLLVVQHISAGFTEGLAHWLDQTVRVPVGVAANGARAGPGVWIAPEGAHLMLAVSGRFLLDPRTSAGPHRPSGDVLFESIATAAGKTGVVIVLSGMGKDGAVGAAAVRQAGGRAIVQDEASAAVYGMPKAAIDLGIQTVLSPGEIASFLADLRYEPLRAHRE